MRPLTSFATRLVCLAGAALVASSSAASAECVMPASICESAQQADVVFYGEVITATTVEPWVQKVAFRVLRPFKGTRKEQFTGVFTYNAESVYFVAGQRVLVFARAHGRRWSTACSRSALVRRPVAQEIEDLAKCPTPPRSPAISRKPR